VIACCVMGGSNTLAKSTIPAMPTSLYAGALPQATIPRFLGSTLCSSAA